LIHQIKRKKISATNSCLNFWNISKFWSVLSRTENIILSHDKWQMLFELVIGFIALLQLRITSNYNVAQISIIHTSFLSLLQPPLVVAWLQSSNKDYSSCPYGSRMALPNHQLKTLKLNFSAAGLLARAQDFLSQTDCLWTNSHFDCKLPCWSSWSSLYSFGTNRTENTSSNSSPIIVWCHYCCKQVFIAPLPSNGWCIWWRGVVCSIVASPFIVPLPSNGCFFHSPCHNIPTYLMLNLNNDNMATLAYDYGSGFLIISEHNKIRANHSAALIP
jgi:hypothetical protein